MSIVKRLKKMAPYELTLREHCVNLAEHLFSLIGLPAFGSSQIDTAFMINPGYLPKASYSEVPTSLG